MKDTGISRKFVVFTLFLSMATLAGWTACGDDSSAGSGPVCGNGKVEQGEECDGQDLGDQSCASLGLEAGNLACKSDCTFDVSACEGQAHCGNGVIEYPEQCEGSDLGGKSCEDLGFTGGTLGCTDGCRFETSRCEMASQCGDGIRAGAEQCDGQDLGGETCASLGLTGGALACKSDCTFDVSACEGQADCGDGQVEYPEECDGSDLNGGTCQDQGYYAGEIACRSDCTFDLSGCEGRCGDGTVNGDEQCDGSDLGGQDCESLGYDGGMLACGSDCTFDTTNCEGTGPVCGNGLVEGVEECDGADLAGKTCESEGYYPGTLGCAGDCTLDYSGCGGRCGDGSINGDEECDGTDFGQTTCESLGFYGGNLVCNADCTLDRSQCEGNCGDGVVNGDEDCDGTDLAGQSCESLNFMGGDLFCDTDCHFDTSACFNMEIDCSDGLDDDGDGLTDCADGDCDGDPACQGVCLADGGQVDCGWQDSGDLSQDGHDRVDAWTGSECPGANVDYSGAEVVYWGTNESQDAASVDVRLWGLSDDLDLIVLQDDGSGCDSALPCVAVSDHSDTEMERLRFRADPGQTYYLVVDGYEGALSDYQIAVNCVEPVTQAIYEEFDGVSDPFDLDGVSIRFVPDGNAPNGYQWASTGSVTSLAVTPGSGQTTQQILQGAETYVEVTLAQPVTFYGQQYDRVYVSSAGWISFGAPDDLLGGNRQALISGPPRIAGHWTPMDPSQGGAVTVDEMADGTLAVSFVDVPNRFGPVAGVNTFQVVVSPAGNIEIVNLAHTGSGFVGISRGYGLQGPTEVNFYNNGVVPDYVRGYYQLFEATIPSPETFDLERSTIRFTPDAQDPHGYDYRTQFNMQPCRLPPGQPTELSFLDGDDSVAVALDFPIQLFGVFYDHIYVGANGYVTFDGPDHDATASVSDHFSVPRISGLFADLDPTSSGAVSLYQVDQSYNGPFVVVRYEGVSAASSNAEANFQVVMFQNGEVVLCYDSVDLTEGLVGISAGDQGNPPPETNFR